MEIDPQLDPQLDPQTEGQLLFAIETLARGASVSMATDKVHAEFKFRTRREASVVVSLACERSLQETSTAKRRRWIYASMTAAYHRQLEAFTRRLETIDYHLEKVAKLVDRRMMLIDLIVDKKTSKTLRDDAKYELELLPELDSSDVITLNVNASRVRDRLIKVLDSLAKMYGIDSAPGWESALRVLADNDVISSNLASELVKRFEAFDDSVAGAWRDLAPSLDSSVVTDSVEAGVSPGDEDVECVDSALGGLDEDLLGYDWVTANRLNAEIVKLRRAASHNPPADTGEMTPGVPEIPAQARPEPKKKRSRAKKKRKESAGEGL